MRAKSLIMFLGFIIFSFVFLSANVFAEGLTDPPLISPADINFAGVSVEMSSNTGAATYRVPIEVPPGRNGIAPKLALAYNSYQKNGWLGVGWSLDIGEIQRSTKRGVNYTPNETDSEPDYVFVINGVVSELALRSEWGANYYGEKIERTFSKYYKNPSGGWTVTTKDGTIYKYGTTSASVQDNAAGVFKWCLDRVQDTNGNYMTVSYWKDIPNGEIYLDRIDYTGNVNGLNPTNYVKFLRETGTRSDAPPMYTTNYRVATAYRMGAIEVYSYNNSLARKYVLGYDYSGSSWRSLLKTVTLYGDDGTSSLSPIQFDYQTGATGFRQIEQEITSNALDWGQDYGRQWVDFNGDGKADFCRVTSNGAGVKCTISTGNAFASEEISASLDAGNGVMGTQWADFDGDGKADFCRTSGYDFKCTVSTGTGLGATYSGSYGVVGYFRSWVDINGDGKTDYCFAQVQGASGYLPCWSSTGTGFNIYELNNVVLLNSVQWADLNGDGRADVCYTGDSNDKWCLLSTGAGFAGASYFGNPVDGDVAGRQWVDVNGDGKADYCRVIGNTVQCALSTGNSFGENISSGAIDVGDATGRQWVDANGDGKADYCRVVGGTVKCLLSTGSGFGPDIQSVAIDVGQTNGRQWTDVNGDGKADYCRLTGTTSDSHVRCTPSLTPENASIDDLLIKVTNPLSGTTTIDYAPSSDYDNDNLPFIVQTVSSITVDDTKGNVSTTNYTYGGGFYKASEREFRGFDYVMSQSADPAGATTEIWFATGFHPEDEIYKGLPLQQVISDAAGKVYEGTVNSYDKTSPYAGVNFPYLSQKDAYVFDGTITREAVDNGTWISLPSIKATTEFHYTDISGAPDPYGNIRWKHFYETLSSGGKKDEKYEYIEYDYSSSLVSNWIVSLPSHTYINDYAGAKKTETWFDHDTNGNLTTKTFGLVLGNKADPTNPKITYSAYRYGHPETITDARGYPTTISYSSTDNPTYTYPVSKTNYLQQIVYSKYDEKFGKPVTVTDPNGIIVNTYNYDAFGRLLSQTNSNNGLDAYAWTEKYYDGLGRTTMTKTAGPGVKVIVTETIYNPLGQVFKTSLPYFDGDSPLWTTYEYDAVGRGTKVTNPDGTYVMKKYYQGRTTLVDANSHQRIEEKDIYGRLIKVEEYTGTYPNASLYATTTYQYDVLGNLTDVYDASTNHNQTHINYDSLSRKINMTDPDMGYWTYQYDANGNLISQTDAKAQTIQFTYDQLNRITNKHYVNCATCTDVNYTYDELWSTYPKGRLTTVTDASGSEKYYYDTLGRATTTIKTINGDSTYRIDTAYDALGRTKSITYPDNEIVNYDYDDGGNLTGVSNYATFSGFNALGQAGTITYANGVTTTQQYYSTNNRLYSITTNSPTAGGLQNISYLYDNVGNIGTLTDYIDGSRTQTFTYDELNRLRFATSAVYGTLEYRFNEIGNITYNSRVGSYTYGTKPHAVHTASSNTYDYDLNGNLTTKNGQTTITYDYDNRASTMRGSNGSVVNVYDYSGQRVKKNGTITGYTVYIGKLYECTGGNCTKYIFAGSTRIASQSTNKTYFYHTDHLGSSNVITDESGTNVMECYYYPFGETISCTSNTTHYKYTGQEKDDETGLYYYGARYYDSVLGRFISPDTIVQDYTDPQFLNRYSYVRNNPLINVDPTGHYNENDAMSDYYGYYSGENGYYSTIDSYSQAASSIFMPTVNAISSVNQYLLNTIGTVAGAIQKGEEWLFIDMLGGNQGDIRALNDTAAVFFPVLSAEYSGLRIANAGLKAEVAGEIMAVGDEADSSISVVRLNNQLSAQEIAGGHAFDKHVVANGEFPGISTREQFSWHIEDVLNNPTYSGQLSNGRSFYYNADSNSVVIRNPLAVDGGTAYRIDLYRYPTPILDYILKLR